MLTRPKYIYMYVCTEAKDFLCRICSTVMLKVFSIAREGILMMPHLHDCDVI